VEANGIGIPLQWVRVPEYEPEELKTIDMEEIVREAKAGEALDWIRGQRVLADWRIRKHAGRLEAKLAERGSAEMSAEDVRQDLEFFAGQTEQAMQIIEGLTQRVDETGPSIDGSATTGSGQVSADLSEHGGVHTVRGTRRYRDMVQSATTQLYGLFSLVTPASMESLERARYHTPFQSDNQSGSDGNIDNFVPFPEGSGGQSNSGESLGDQIEELEDQLEEIGDDADLADVDLQDMLDKQRQTIQTMSDASKTLHDTAMAVIRKIGG